MQFSRFSFVMAVGLLLATVIASVAGEKPKTTTITGEVIDPACYVGMGKKGSAHEMCAISCIKSGLPVAILEDGSNKVFFAIKAGHPAEPANDLLVQYAAKKVRVTGTVAETNGVSFIMLEKVEKVQ